MKGTRLLSFVLFFIVLTLFARKNQDMVPDPNAARVGEGWIGGATFVAGKVAAEGRTGEMARWVDDAAIFPPELASPGSDVQFCECITHKTLKLTTPFMRGAEVEILQDLLSRAGFYRGKQDRVFGPLTRDAVKAFQKATGLRADGVVGYLTWTRLFEETMGEGAPVVSSPGEDRRSRVIVIDVEARTLILYDGMKVLLEVPCAVGKPVTPTPAGDWRIVSKKSWGGGFGTRWMGLSVPWGQYGIHGTNKPWSIGQAASGGCIRLHNSDVERLFDMVDVGTRVKILGGPHGIIRSPRRFLGLGERGADVLEVQRRLVELGVAKLSPDGVYREATVEAVKRFQKLRGIRITGEVDDATYDALGLVAFE